MSENSARAALIQYLEMKVRECDWHGVADAACDLRVMEARLDHQRIGEAYVEDSLKQFTVTQKELA